MPQLQEFQVKAHQVRKGDVLTYVDPEAIRSGKTRVNTDTAPGKPLPGVTDPIVDTVRDTYTKTVSIYLKDDAGLVLMYREGDVTVNRMVKTDAEMAEDKAREVQRSIERAVAEWLYWSTLDPMAYLNEKAQKYGPASIGDMLGWHAQTAIEMSKQREIGDSVKKMQEDEERDLVVEQIFDYVLEEANRQIHSKARFLESSTNPISNLKDRIELKVWADLLDSSSVSYVLYVRENA
jgi:hypothetical protein